MPKKDTDFYRPEMVKVARKDIKKRQNESSTGEEELKKFFGEVWDFVGSQGKTEWIRLIAPFESKSYLSFKGVSINAMAGDTIKIGRFKEGFTITAKENDKIVISVDAMVKVDGGYSRYYKQFIMDDGRYGIGLYQILDGETRWSSVYDQESVDMMSLYFDEARRQLRHGGPATG